LDVTRLNFYYLETKFIPHFFPFVVRDTKETKKKKKRLERKEKAKIKKGGTKEGQKKE